MTNSQAKPEQLVGEGAAFQFDSHHLDDALTAKVNLGSGNLEPSRP